MNQKQTLWTRNFTLVTVATAFGAAGGIAASFALSFLVFDETGSTLAAAITIAASVIPGFIVPLFLAPFMDRLPRKPVLVAGDLINALLYAVAGIYLHLCEFSYIGFLLYSLLVSTLSAFDELAYNSIYPKLIPVGMEEKGYAVSSLLYPILKVIMTPLSALMYQTLGVANILLFQAGFSLFAALTESRIRIREENRMSGKRVSVTLWWEGIKEAIAYLKGEKGLRALFLYMGATNGMYSGYYSLITAFFRTAAGFSISMYSFFTVVEFLGRSVGGVLRYRVKLDPKKKYGFAYFVYQMYNIMDGCLLWLPYPLMLVNRTICGFLGVQSATLREAAVQKYIPDKMRSRINAFQTMITTFFSAVLALVLGAAGEVLPYAWCLTIGAVLSLLLCVVTVWRQRASLKKMYEAGEATAAEAA